MWTNFERHSFDFFVKQELINILPVFVKFGQVKLVIEQEIFYFSNIFFFTNRKIFSCNFKPS